MCSFIFEITRISTNSAMSLMRNRFKYGVNRSFRGAFCFSRCQTRQFIEFIGRLMRRPAPTGSIVKLQRECVVYWLCLRGHTCDLHNVALRSDQRKKKREPEATREECNL